MKSCFFQCMIPQRKGPFIPKHNLLLTTVRTAPNILIPDQWITSAFKQRFTEVTVQLMLPALASACSTASWWGGWTLCTKRITVYLNFRKLFLCRWQKCDSSSSVFTFISFLSQVQSETRFQTSLKTILRMSKFISWNNHLWIWLEKYNNLNSFKNLFSLVAFSFSEIPTVAK